MTFNPSLVWKVEAGWLVRDLRWVLGFWYGPVGQERRIEGSTFETLPPALSGLRMDVLWRAFDAAERSAPTPHPSCGRKASPDAPPAADNSNEQRAVIEDAAGESRGWS